MTRARRWTALLYLLCAVAVIEALGWTSWQLLRLERQTAHHRAEVEAVQLALWRMDSWMSSLLATEAARPYFHYRAFYPADRAYTRMWQEVEAGEVLVPSPLLGLRHPLIRLHFELDPAGQLHSPQVPRGTMRDQAEAQYVTAEQVAQAEAQLRALSGLLEARRLRAAGPVDAGPERARAAGGEAAGAEPAVSAGADYVARRLTAEWARRADLAEMSPTGVQDDELDFDKVVAYLIAAERQEEGIAARAAGRAPEPSRVELSGLSPVWLVGEADGTPELVFVRTVGVDDTRLVQGIWFDWPALRAALLATVTDLLPAAALYPMVEGARERGGEAAGGAWYALGGFPAELEPGVVPMAPLPMVTPLRATLGVTWLAMLVALAAIGLVLRASVQLSERRGRFASAVSHELRTPLTTFRLYTQMLAGGHVTDEATRQAYLETLQRESHRLARIVEGVLAYARLGARGGRRGKGSRTVASGQLLERVVPVLRRRAEADGMELVVSAAPASVPIRADIDSVEQILLNLVDNACKYAGGAADRRLHLDIELRREALELTLRDHGPGVARAARLFEPFCRGEGEATERWPGLGLGLALARGLARDLGGDLRHVAPAGSGAAFTLTLRRVRARGGQVDAGISRRDHMGS